MKDGYKLPTKLIKLTWATGKGNPPKMVEITDAEKIEENLRYLGRVVLLDSIIKEYKDTNLLSGDKPHNSKLIPAFENGERTQEKLVITERGCSLCNFQPAFYVIDLKTNTWEERIPHKKNAYFIINFGGKQIPVPSLSCLAFVKNENPNELLAPDHINDFYDSVVLYETYQLYDFIKIYAERSEKTWHGLEPDKISWSPKNLQWLSREDNNAKANGRKGWEEAYESQQRFVKFIEDGDTKIRRQAQVFDCDELDKMKDIADHPNYIKGKEDNAVWEHEQLSEAWYEDTERHDCEVEACLKHGERKYVETELINNQIFGTEIGVVEDVTGLFTPHFRKKDIPLLDFVEKYVACSHMKDWDDTMWDDVIQWVRWATNNGHINSEKTNPKLKIVGHKILAPYGKWPELDDGKKKSIIARTDWAYLFNELLYFAEGLHYNEDTKQRLLKKMERESFQLVA